MHRRLYNVDGIDIEMAGASRGAAPDETAAGSLALSRRTVLAAGAASAIMPMMAASFAGASAAPPQKELYLTVNGKQHGVSAVDPRTSLLDLLRERLDTIGPKKGCDHGQCGACTVLLDGRRTLSCLTLAVMHDGAEVTTVEGLGTPEKLHPLQAAFMANDGFQCGFCTPGQICSAIGMLDEARRGMPSHVSANLDSVSLNDAEIKERMSGNLCRCAAYPGIVAAIRSVANKAVRS